MKLIISLSFFSPARHSFHVHRQSYAGDLQTRSHCYATWGFQPESGTQLDKTEPRHQRLGRRDLFRRRRQHVPSGSVQRDPYHKENINVSRRPGRRVRRQFADYRQSQ